VALQWSARVSCPLRPARRSRISASNRNTIRSVVFDVRFLFVGSSFFNIVAASLAAHCCVARLLLRVRVQMRQGSVRGQVRTLSLSRDFELGCNYCAVGVSKARKLNNGKKKRGKKKRAKLIDFGAWPCRCLTVTSQNRRGFWGES
jgi:hypothetical protein